ncbi:hypothetical protein LMG24238_04969 [Paraburkholderia sediminicola]|uniref:Uncharacterized protein n=1 Tax=Paraburkholderia sediminicola TaxID=458836 RepID=A0A6J5BZB0_9BURK|nr:hypothetical protein LMG24238_04969 [Paraburkholderia sediminicola]
MWGDLRTWPVYGRWWPVVAADRYLTNIPAGRAQAVGLVG